MGQKTNSKILRLGYKNNEWESLYISKNQQEFSLFVLQDLAIKSYIYRFFKRYKILIQECRLSRSNDTFKIFISYFVTLNSIYLINDLTLNQKISVRRKESFNNGSYRDKNNCIKMRLWIIKELKGNIKDKNDILLNFAGKFTQGLIFYTSNKLNIKCIFQNVNKSLSLRLKNKDLWVLRKKLVKLRKYNKSNFFQEFINIQILLSKKSKSSHLLSELIAFQFNGLKRHNFFFNFLKKSLTLILNSKFSNIKGIKIIIRGRLNGKPRSSNRLIQIGRVPLQTLDSTIDYSESTSFTAFGTFGIKVWVCEKKK